MKDIVCGDVLEVCKSIPDNTFHGILSDPPYGLKFMGKKWDYELPSVNTFSELLRVCRPGAYALFFGGSRTFHRLACNIEDAGWEIRDTIMWIYSQGFPKSMDIAKKMEDNNVWEGYGTALKPAFEPIIVCRKPIEGTVGYNVIKWGCGGINIDRCRIEYSEYNPPIPQLAQGKRSVCSDNKMYGRNSFNESKTKSMIGGDLRGRFPSNIILDGSEEVNSLFPYTKSGKPCGKKKAVNKIFGTYKNTDIDVTVFGDQGSASRFFYCAKASKKERGEGNTHPTVKPIKVCEYLARLIKPPVEDAKILIPFSGSGSEIVGSIKAGWSDYLAIDNDQQSVDISKQRVKEHLQ